MECIKVSFEMFNFRGLSFRILAKTAKIHEVMLHLHKSSDVLLL